MAQNRSLKAYIVNRFYNEIGGAIENYISEYPKQLKLRTRKVHRIDEIAVDDIKPKTIAVDDLPQMKIKFDLVVAADLIVKEADYPCYKEDYISRWFVLNCFGDLARRLDDFCISSVDVYTSKNRPANPLNDSLVPELYLADLEAAANDFLERHYRKALYAPTPVDPHELAKKMGLTVYELNITNDMSVFGQIFFADCDTQYYDPKTKSYHTIRVKAKTVFVDKEAYFLRNLGNVNNTIVHECVHYDRHKKAFALEWLHNEQASQIRCQVVGGIKNDKVWSSADRMEWQANALAPRILMPYTQTKIKAKQLIDEYKARFKKAETVDVLEYVIDEIASFFGVSRISAKIRMVELGFEEAVGVFIYIDGRYVKPHSFRKGAITKKQTYSVSVRDAVIASVVNRDFNAKLKSGEYQFIDSHYCLNHPKYITKDEDGNPCLTNYALHHMDECCLVFDLTVKTVNKYSKHFYTACVVYRDADLKIVFEANYSNCNAGNESKRDSMIKRYLDDVRCIYQKLPESFSEALVLLMDWSGMSVKQLSDATYLEPRHLTRLRNNQVESPKLKTVIALCIGMSLPPKLSFALLKRAGYTLKSTEQDMMYGFLLSAYYAHSIKECNELLYNQGLDTLFKFED